MKTNVLRLRLALFGALAAAVVLALAACGGDGDDDSEKTPALATASAVAKRTVESRATARALGTNVPDDAGSGVTGGDSQDGTPSVGDGTPGSDSTPGSDGTPGADGTIGPEPTATPIPTVAPGQLGTVTLDSNPDTPQIEHDELTVPVGSEFRIAVSINKPSRSYGGYEYGLHWQEPTVAFVGEQPLRPSDLGLCVDPKPQPLTTGIYAGCLRTSGETTFEGQVAIVTLRCESAGRSILRMLALAEATGFGAALLEFGGTEFDSSIDEGFHVQCT